MRESGSRYRRASEVGEWHYCQRAWWLHQVAGHAPAASARLARGTRAHAAHGATLRRARWARWAALLLAALALALFLLGGWG